MSGKVSATAITVRAATEDETPGNALRLAKLADDCGWSVRMTYACGTSLPTRAFPRGVLIESIAVRMRKEGHALVGVWTRAVETGGALRFTWGGAPFQTMTLAEIKAALEP